VGGAIELMLTFVFAVKLVDAMGVELEQQENKLLFNFEIFISRSPILSISLSPNIIFEVPTKKDFSKVSASYGLVVGLFDTNATTVLKSDGILM
jgi:hypothetical protein